MERSPRLGRPNPQCPRAAGTIARDYVVIDIPLSAGLEALDKSLQTTFNLGGPDNAVRAEEMYAPEVFGRTGAVDVTVK